MTINKYWSWELPKKIYGTAIVVDTFAAMTNLSIILSKKPRRLIIINGETLEKAKNIYPGSLVIGESVTLPKSIFVCSNFPSDIIKEKFKDRIVLYMSSNGTRVIEEVWKYTRDVIGCSFNNMLAVIKFLKSQREKHITIVMSGELRKEVFDDKICAQVIIKELTGETYNWQDIVDQITINLRLYYKAVRKDFESLTLTLNKNQYNIVPVVFKNREGFLEVRKTMPL